MIRPTARALVVFALGLPIAALPTLLGDGWWFAWAAWLVLVLLALLIELGSMPWRRAVALEVDIAPVLHIGTEEPLLVRVMASRAVELQIRVECSGPVAPLPELSVHTAPGATGVVSAPLRATRRGVIRCVALHARWAGGLRLLWRELIVPVGRELAVIPDVRAVRARALRLVGRREFQVGLKVERYVGDGSEFDSLREFVAGMDRRAIDWKATARHRRLLVREFRAERDHQVLLCVDAGRLMGEPLQGLPRLDHAIHAALQLGYVCLRTGDRVGWFAFADRGLTFVPPQAGVHALHAIQEQATGLDYSAAETNFTLSVTELLQRLHRRTLVVLFTEFVDSITTELMLPNVAHLARRHLLLFVALRDPLLDDLAGRRPATATDLHRAAVADELVRERRLVLERIRRAGAQVLDASIDELDAGLVDRYLQIKRKELA
ncbi:MAG: DUF58 domain-containing protein [Planctomycetes bacterium]|nr:DUF58 domain-containing protein [Planctomycetota bacterium]